MRSSSCLILSVALLLRLTEADLSSEECSVSKAQSLLQVAQGFSDAVTVRHAQATARHLASHLAKVVRHNSTESSTRELLQSFRICGACQHFERFGEHNDGGYLTCLDGLASGGKLQAAYSLGVEHHDKWSEDVSRKLALRVNQFDCSVSDGGSCEDCRFFKKCLRPSSSTADAFPLDFVTLAEALALSGQRDAPPRSLLLKIDIEGSEWPIFVDESKPELLQKFQQIVAEFHDLDKVDRHPQYLKAVENILNAGFRVAHLHGNNFGGMYGSGENLIPKVLEVTYISTGGGKERHCLTGQEMLPEDEPNNPGAPELAPAKLGGV